MCMRQRQLNLTLQYDIILLKLKRANSKTSNLVTKFHFGDVINAANNLIKQATDRDHIPVEKELDN